MTLPPEIVSLIEKFETHKDAYKSGKYNETQLRREFLDPFFEALGWDVFNKQGFSETYKEVLHEDKIKVNGSTKAPDYSFRVGDKRKFFVEAKKPSIYIKDDMAPAFQVRSYGWSAGLPFSILTDFEEFAVYDTLVTPKAKDSASTARIFYCTYKEYEKNWEWITSIFSKTAIYQGKFDKFINESKGKRGTETVDKKFLKDIEKWRLDLAQDIARKNDIDIKSLNYSVGITIDRILFLRICEDRGIEPYEQLLNIAGKKDIHSQLKQIYHKADQKYNSGLFHFDKEKGRNTDPDELTPNLNIDDKVLKSILQELYYPRSPYQFSVIDADILGNVYEQFLGKIIRLTPKSAKVEEKPEVKKAGGVFYTPRYIVEYIIESTLGEKLKKMTPKEVAGETAKYPAPLRVLDPACGSGSFLIFAYQYLLDWHRDWYSANNPDKHKKAVFKSAFDEWRLTAAEKKKILLNNIFGVDIDHQAVEVTKLNLLLKVLENESAETIESQLSMFHERALPDLEHNIKCGNSLIGPDFYDSTASAQPQLFETMSEEEKEKVNIFDWKAEWPQIMTGDNPGFDVVIGNPPYVRQEVLGPAFKTYAQKKFDTYAGTADLYVYFIEKSLSVLKAKGLYSIIVANKWLRANYGDALRNYLKKKRIHELIDFGDLPVFQNATTYPLILKASNDKPKDFDAVKQNNLLLGKEGNPPLEKVVKKLKYKVTVDTLEEDGWSLSNEAEARLLTKLKQTGKPLGEYVDGKIYYGIKTGLNEAFVIDEATKDRLIAEDPNSAEIIKPFLAGRDIKRYQKPVSDKFLIFTRRGIDIKKYPAILKHLEIYKDRLKPKPNNWPSGKAWGGRKPGSYQWYEIQDSIDYFEEFEKEKIILPAIVNKSTATNDKEAFYSNDKTSIISSSELYLIAILNNPLINWIFKRIASTKQGGYFEQKPVYIEKLPIRTIDFDNPDDKAMHDQMVTLVERMLDLNKRLPEAKTPHDKTSLERHIASTDSEIDRLVYRLYDLTPEEIAIVEGG